MISITMRYPNDPPTDVLLMFGAEFHTHIRKGKPGQITINGELVAESDEIVCDVCNAEVGLTDPCAMTPGYLYCAACMKSIAPHFDKNSIRVNT